MNNLVDKELDRLRERYPDEFAELYADELAKPSPFLKEGKGEEIKRIAACAVALQILKDRHG